MKWVKAHYILSSLVENISHLEVQVLDFSTLP